MTARLRELLDAAELGGKAIPNGKQVADLLAEVILKNALKGDHRFVSTVLDRTEGKVADKTEVVNSEGETVDYRNITVEFVKAPDRPDEDPTS